MYEENIGAPEASLLETRLFINSVIYDSNQGDRLFSDNLKDFF